MSLEETLQNQVDLVSYYLGLKPSEVEMCLLNPSSPKCRVVWRLANDQFLTLDEDAQWTLALEMDMTTLENLCKISLIMRRFCKDDAFWAAKFRKDLNLKTKYSMHEEETWKQNYLLAFKHNSEPLQDLTDLELEILADNHDVQPGRFRRKSILSTFERRFLFASLYQIRSSMISFPLSTREGLLNVRMEKNIEFLNLSYMKLTTLPPEISFLSSLKIFYLSFNDLTTLPSEIGNLSSLQKLHLGWNPLLTLPSEIGNLQNLRELDLNNTNLTTLPREMEKLTSLERLAFDQESSITYEDIPPEIQNLPFLTIEWVRTSL